ncbi:MAG: hypothetical protein EPO67_03870 [Reyranella sp.]|nr:MAG: hypothetical protein EPO67_03870 [Reyranella sp.]
MHIHELRVDAAWNRRRPLTAGDILGHAGLREVLRRQSGLLFDGLGVDPRLAVMLASQPRLLMGHAGLGLCFRAGTPARPGSVSRVRFSELISLHDLASRRTADAFVKDMLACGYARLRTDVSDRRTQPIEPTAAGLDAVRGWLIVHLSTLDQLDGRDGSGSRLNTFVDTPDSLALLQPAVSDRFLSSQRMRELEHAAALGFWLHGGGLDRELMFAGLDESVPATERIPVGALSVPAMAGRLRHSRWEMASNLRAAEAAGRIGWSGKRGWSEVWISGGLLREVAMAEAVKLALIDDAFADCFGGIAFAQRPMAAFARKSEAVATPAASSR